MIDLYQSIYKYVILDFKDLSDELGMHDDRISTLEVQVITNNDEICKIKENLGEFNQIKNVHNTDTILLVNDTIHVGCCCLCFIFYFVYTLV